MDNIFGTCYPTILTRSTPIHLHELIYHPSSRKYIYDTRYVANEGQSDSYNMQFDTDGNLAFIICCKYTEDNASYEEELRQMLTSFIDKTAVSLSAL